METTYFVCGCWITRDMVTHKVKNCEMCSNHRVKAIGIRNKEQLAKLILKLAAEDETPKRK